MASEKYVILFSNSCIPECPSNTIARFRNNLNSSLNLEGDWQGGLIDISVPFKSFNFEEMEIGFYVPVSITNQMCNDQEINYVEKVEDEESGINRTLSKIDDSASFHSVCEEVETTNLNEELNIEESVIKTTQFIFKSGTLSAGYYSSVSEIVNEIVKLYHKLFKNFHQSNNLLLDLKILYYSHLNKVSISAVPLLNLHSSWSIMIGVYNNSLFENILGFQSEKVQQTLDSSEFFKLEVFQNAQLSSTPCSLKLYNKIYVCTDIIDHQHIGGISAPLLTSTSIAQNGKCKIGLSRYHSLRFSNIESIEIQIFSNILNYEYIPCTVIQNDSEYVECTLHFRRQSLFQSCI